MNINSVFQHKANKQQIQRHRSQVQQIRRGITVRVHAAVLLEIKDLHVKASANSKVILKGVNLNVSEGEVHAIMGKNGSGKSTLGNVLVGNPEYEIIKGTILFKGEDVTQMEPEERANKGMFLSFQNPIEIPGVNNVDFLRMAYNAKQVSRNQPEIDPLEFYQHLTPIIERCHINPSFLGRNVNEGFSGGEKKRNEILQLAVLDADLAILDEIDSGLDVDALKDVAQAVQGLKRKDNSLLMITHYKRLLDLIQPDFVHIMKDGEIVRTGDIKIAETLESEGYASLAT